VATNTGRRGHTKRRRDRRRDSFNGPSCRSRTRSGPSCSNYVSPSSISSISYFAAFQ